MNPLLLLLLFTALSFSPFHIDNFTSKASLSFQNLPDLLSCTSCHLFLPTPGIRNEVLRRKHHP